MLSERSGFIENEGVALASVGSPCVSARRMPSVISLM